MDSNLRTAAQQALEAWDAGDTEWFKRAYSVMDALKAALVEDAMQKFTDVNQELEAALAEDIVTHGNAWSKDGKRIDPMSIYAEPVQEGCDHCNHPMYAAIKCRVCGTVTEPVQEPVAWLTPKTVDSYMRPDLGYETCSKTDYAAFPVYTAPPQRKPLTDEEIRDFYYEHAKYQEAGARVSGWWEFARAVEAAHGIKE